MMQAIRTQRLATLRLISASMFALLSYSASTWAATPSFPCVNAPTLPATLPGDSLVLSQPGFNCFAWKEFLALNWPADPKRSGEPDPNARSKDFGAPGANSRPAVWESYMDVHGVMRENAEAPIPWGSSTPLPQSCRPMQESAGGLRTLRMTSKFRVEFDAGADTAEAFPNQGKPNWLADRDGNLVWYEILMNKPEYDYFVKTRYYDADQQSSAVANGAHVDLPKGELIHQPGGKITSKAGAIEIKAAWLSVPEGEEGSAKWSTYKLSRSLVYDPRHPDAGCKTQTVALVGLHILHKTTTQPQWVWATFEHQDNAPDMDQALDGSAGDRYRFYNPNCQAQPVSDHCQTYAPPSCAPPARNAQTSCALNQPPNFCLKLTGPGETCAPKPVQVARRLPIPASLENPVVQTNQAAQSLIRQYNPNSVLQNYQLVNVLWSDSAVDENQFGQAPPKAPLSLSGLRPSLAESPIANTMMETYAQELTCQSCHSTATIAPTDEQPNPVHASDYSFIVPMANSSSD